MTTTTWTTYEEVARYLLDRFATEFGLSRVEPKQVLAGQRSGTNWEVDAKGVNDGDGTFVLVECRRHTTQGQKQEQIAALSYKITDTGAAGGIVVSPLPLQEGAAKVAAAEDIVHVTLTPESTAEEFSIRFFNQIHLQFCENFETSRIKDHATIELRDLDGNLIEKREIG